MMNTELLRLILIDGLLAAVASIGFAVISNPSRKAIAVSALLAAIGHGLRFALIKSGLEKKSLKNSKPTHSLPENPK